MHKERGEIVEQKGLWTRRRVFQAIFTASGQGLPSQP